VAGHPRAGSATKCTCCRHDPVGLVEVLDGHQTALAAAPLNVQASGSPLPQRALFVLMGRPVFLLCAFKVSLASGVSPHWPITSSPARTNGPGCSGPIPLVL